MTYTASHPVLTVLRTSLVYVMQGFFSHDTFNLLRDILIIWQKIYKTDDARIYHSVFPALIQCSLLLSKNATNHECQC